MFFYSETNNLELRRNTCRQTHLTYSCQNHRHSTKRSLVQLVNKVLYVHSFYNLASSKQMTTNYLTSGTEQKTMLRQLVLLLWAMPLAQRKSRATHATSDWGTHWSANHMTEKVTASSQRLLYYVKVYHIFLFLNITKKKCWKKQGTLFC